MNIHKTKAFTLVELIVVVTILAILATIGFVSYSSYLTGVRDTNRLAQLVSIHDGLELYRTKKDLPLPDENVEVKTNGDLIAYQGYVGKNTLETIDFTKGGKDPKDHQYFSYILTKDRKYFQLLAFLEEEENLQADISVGHVTYAADYSTRVPTVYGKKLGILTDDENTPIQEISSISITGELDLTNATTGYRGHVTDTETYTGSMLLSINPKASCKRIKQMNGGSSDGVYKINPTGISEFEVYCDMTTDGGGWTLLWKNFGGPNHVGSGTPLSNATLWTSTSGSKLARPFDISKTFGSEINIHAFEDFKNQLGLDLIKYSKGYDSSRVISNNVLDTYTVILDLGGGVSYADLMDTTSCKVLVNQVEMIVNGESVGKTDRTAGANTSQSMGLANDFAALDACGQGAANVTSGYAPRHLISYDHTASGRDSIRCQSRCWDGTEGLVQEIVWGIR